MAFQIHSLSRKLNELCILEGFGSLLAGKQVQIVEEGYDVEAETRRDGAPHCEKRHPQNGRSRRLEVDSGSVRERGVIVTAPRSSCAVFEPLPRNQHESGLGAESHEK